ncbi:MAG: arsenate reductase (glutaredoxin) [Planctomycetota bacterium]|nr:MAG: arsenate reductase (glutaredoxin) [Planctomycetota bacterium]
MKTTLTLWFHAACSKSRKARELLAARELELELFEYQVTPPTREQLEELLCKLDEEDPRKMARAKEALFSELGLDDADRDAVLDALVAHPELIERPIAVLGDKAIIARPPERALELLLP